jgi:superfamily II DNA or RNA helicase
MDSIKRELTVRAKENAMGLRPLAFKVYKDLPHGKIKIPRFFRASQNTPTTKGLAAPNMEFKGTLHAHQKEALQCFKGNGVLCLPCGKGKTATAIAIASRLKRKTLVIVHKEFLAIQWKERIEQFCPAAKVGRIQCDIFDTDGKDFVIALIQTVCSRDYDMKDFGLVIVDEAHHIGAPAFSRSMFKMDPEYTLGLTATPERKDGLSKVIFWFLGDIFYSMDQDSRTINHIRINFDHQTFRKGPIINKIGKPSIAHMINEITELEERNELIISKLKECIERKRCILVLSDRRSHCELIHSKLGPDVSGLYIGGMAQEDQEMSSHKQVVIATFSLAYEGLDIPSLDTLFLVTPHSDIKQAVGRITRGDPETPREVYDFVDNWTIFPSMFYRRKKSYEIETVECLL